MVDSLLKMGYFNYNLALDQPTTPNGGLNFNLAKTTDLGSYFIQGIRHCKFVFKFVSMDDNPKSRLVEPSYPSTWTLVEELFELEKIFEELRLIYAVSLKKFTSIAYGGSEASAITTYIISSSSLD
ncbi:hypothetical protein LguiB_011907 [Lonicera macranthoides]